MKCNFAQKKQEHLLKKVYCVNWNNSSKRWRRMTKQEQKIAQEFWAEVEKEAARLEITVDYYLAEFFSS